MNTYDYCFRTVLRVEMRESVSETVKSERLRKYGNGGTELVETITRTTRSMPIALLECGHEQEILLSVKRYPKKMRCLQCFAES